MSQNKRQEHSNVLRDGANATKKWTKRNIALWIFGKPSKYGDILKMRRVDASVIILRQPHQYREVNVVTLPYHGALSEKVKQSFQDYDVYKGYSS